MTTERLSHHLAIMLAIAIAIAIAQQAERVKIRPAGVASAFP